MTKKWLCTVCGYIHEGDEPPDICPVCGADRSAFVPAGEQDANERAAAEAPTPPKEKPLSERPGRVPKKIGLIEDLWETLIIHGVAAHFPNGVLPTAFLFLLLTLVLDLAGMEEAVFYLLVVVLAVVPVSLVSGILDWRNKFGGAKVRIFYQKIILASLLFVLGALAVALRALSPDLMDEGGLLKIMYIAVVAAMVGIAIMLGHLGAKLVFQWKKLR